MPVAGGVNARPLGAGQALLQNPDLLSASTTLLQSGGGGFARLINALQLLDQSGAVIALATDFSTLQSTVATLQSQVATLQAQAAAFTAFMASFNYQQLEVSTGTYFLDNHLIYRRSFVISGALNTALNIFTYPHTIPAINYLVTIQAIAAINAGQGLPLTFVQTNQAPAMNNGIGIWADTTNIYISNGSQIYTNYLTLATMFYTATDR